MAREINFENEFSTLEKAMEYAGTDEEKAIITRDHRMYYVVDCERVSDFRHLGYDHI
ncbi:hypothetical protein ACFYKX_01115 [Cytobacillus sp. FJAT-54145]|uniref:Uncharacterized protein n=1 Tax=Cytobacillus spartinae TaxID=3299023 RepID=A0ABW6K8G0_9BACI